jgi:hypothetical protein
VSDRLAAAGRHPVVYCDTVQSAGLHNGNARILMTRFDVAGTAMPALEIIVPISEVKTFITALQKLSR